MKNPLALLVGYVNKICVVDIPVTVVGTTLVDPDVYRDPDIVKLPVITWLPVTPKFVPSKRKFADAKAALGVPSESKTLFKPALVIVENPVPLVPDDPEVPEEPEAPV